MMDEVVCVKMLSFLCALLFSPVGGEAAEEWRKRRSGR